MRDAPLWFQDALGRVGGLNPYGEPIFRLSWSTDELTVFGGERGYRTVRAVPGDGCWALMVWEPREGYGSYSSWMEDYWTGEHLACGGYPKFGRYRLLQRFIHREIVQKEEYGLKLDGRMMVPDLKVKQQVVTSRMEPCGLMLDLMLPMLMSWRRLSSEQKLAAVQQEEQLRRDEFSRVAKDALAGTRIRRGSQLVQKRAELIEKGMAQAMKMASQTGLGMRIGD